MCVSLKACVQKKRERKAFFGKKHNSLFNVIRGLGGSSENGGKILRLLRSDKKVFQKKNCNGIWCTISRYKLTVEIGYNDHGYNELTAITK